MSPFHADVIEDHPGEVDGEHQQEGPDDGRDCPGRDVNAQEIPGDIGEKDGQQ